MVLAKLASWYINDLLFSWFCENWNDWVNFSKFSQIWAEVGSNLTKFEEKKSGNFGQIWPKILGRLLYQWVNFFQKLVYVWVHFHTFKFPAAHPYQNQTWDDVSISHGMKYTEQLNVQVYFYRYMWPAITKWA